MIKMIYSISPDEKQEEIEWLREQKIFPAVESYFDYTQLKHMVHFGVIVSPDAALLIKLRHKLDLQDEYRQR